MIWRYEYYFIFFGIGDDERASERRRQLRIFFALKELMKGWMNVLSMFCWDGNMRESVRERKRKRVSEKEGSTIQTNFHSVPFRSISVLFKSNSFCRYGITIAFYVAIRIRCFSSFNLIHVFDGSSFIYLKWNTRQLG